MANTHQSECIFCRIIAGALPAVRVLETERVLAFMDAFPASTGHLLVIPKAHYPDVFALPADLLADCAQAAQRLARAQRRALEPDGAAITQYNGAAAGQTVYHYHLHVIPRWHGQARHSHGKAKADPEELEAVAERIRRALD